MGSALLVWDGRQPYQKSATYCFNGRDGTRVSARRQRTSARRSRVQTLLRPLGTAGTSLFCPLRHLAGHSSVAI